MCLAPLILVGYLMTLHPNVWHVSEFDGPMVQVYTCERGLGANVRYASKGIGALGIHYGVAYQSGNWSVSFLPQFGVGYLSQHVPEVSSRVNFDLAASVIVGYKQSRLAVEYWHQSNAGLGDRNAGLDMLAMMGGMVF